MCVTIVALLKARYSMVGMHTLLRLLKVNELRVYRVKKLFEVTNVRNHPRAGQPCSTCTKNMVNAIHTQITRNPYYKQKIFSQDMNLVPRTILGVLEEDLDL